MAVKVSVGELCLSKSTERYFVEHLAHNDFAAVPIDIRHIGLVETLPHHHGDPFDRLLIAQAKALAVPIVSVDKVFSQYGLQRVS
jgi:PIN domain nuclease of toxin-antitoxin system